MPRIIPTLRPLLICLMLISAPTVAAAQPEDSAQTLTQAADADGAKQAPPRTLPTRATNTALTPPDSEHRPSGYGALLLQMLLSVAVVCALAILTLKYGLKRLLPKNPHSDKMAVLARMPLEPRRSLLVVRVGSKHLILASSEAGIQPVAELTPAQAADFVAEGAKPEIPLAFTVENSADVEDRNDRSAMVEVAVGE